MRKRMVRNGIRLFFGGVLSAVMVATSAFGSLGTPKVQAAGNLTDPIMVASFWTSATDTTDTIYFSTDGVNFHEICEAFTDRSPDTDDSVVNITRSQYHVL